jgi:hypothetical protein
MNKLLTSLFFAGSLLLVCNSCTRQIQTDVFIAGGGTSGIAAGIQASRMGVKTVIAEEYKWLGGMLTSAGVSAVDGNYRLQGGIWKEFKDSLSTYYGGDSLLQTGWVSNVLFEPSVGNRIFSNMAAKEKYLTVIYDSYVESVTKKKKGWLVKLRNKRENSISVYSASVLIDATELGDVAKLCGVKYDIGMDSNRDTGEDIAPEMENDIIQDLTYVAILKDYGKPTPLKRPAGYDSLEFACSCINPLCTSTQTKDRLWPKESMITYGKLPDNKYMINWPISGNDYYVNVIEMTREERKAALEPARNRTLSFVYFIQNELGFRNLSLADDEFPSTDMLPFIPYHRESRRIHGKVRFTVNHITRPYDQSEKLYRTCIGVGDYPIDHHHSRYSGADSLPDLHFYPVPSYGLPLGVIIPAETEDLLVAEKSISVTNLVNGSTRLQPVVLQIGQAAGAMAALAVKNDKGINDAAVRDVQNIILDAGGYLLPYLDVQPGHLFFKPMQRIGSTGIMKGIGKNSGWSNLTFFRSGDITLLNELEGLNEFYDVGISRTGDTLTVNQAAGLVKDIADFNKISIEEQEITSLLSAIGCTDPKTADRPILRGEMALLIDMILDPFNSFSLDIKGSIVRN